MDNRLPEEIRTARLHLRPHRLDDVDDVFAFAADPEWARYLPIAQPYVRRHADEFIARQILLDWSVHPSWAIVLDDQVVGGINLMVQPAERAGEIGYSTARRVWGQGITTEAVAAVVAEAFRAIPDLNRVGARADVRNGASRRVMEKVGMTREGVLRQKRVSRGEVIDEVWYSILRGELPPSEPRD